MRDFARLVKFLEKVQFQILGTESLSDQELIDAAQSLWDAQIDDGDVIPEGTVFPTTILDGVTASWDEDNKGFVLSKGTIFLRDNLDDDDIPASFDEAADHVLLFHDDEYAMIAGGSFDEELILIDVTA